MALDLEVEKGHWLSKALCPRPLLSPLKSPLNRNFLQASKEASIFLQAATNDTCPAPRAQAHTVVGEMQLLFSSDFLGVSL